MYSDEFDLELNNTLFNDDLENLDADALETWDLNDFNDLVEYLSLEEELAL